MKQNNRVVTVKQPTKSQFERNRADKLRLEKYYSSFLPKKMAFLAAGVTQTPTSLMSGLDLGRSIISGQGDYHVKGGGSVPSFKKAESTVITHREYITDVKSGALVGGSTAFTIDKYPINPGRSQTFPWLAAIASNYEEYEILGMVFQFVATSGESVASTNTSLGTVILATEYDPTKPDFVNKQAMENYSFASSNKPSVSQIHAIECKKNLSPVKQLYVRSGPVTGTDLRWSDFGNFFLATVGCPAAGTNLGELWVSYKIRLHKPRLPITVGLGGQIATGYTQRTGAVTNAGLGTTAVITRGSIPLTITDGRNLGFPGTPDMNYLVTVCVTAATSCSQINAGTAVNCEFAPMFNGPTFTATGTGPVTMYQINVKCTSTDTDAICSLNLASLVTIVGDATTDILVTQLDETAQ